MFKQVILATFVAAAAVGLGYAAQPKSTVNVVGREPAANGKQMYMGYCASCHGVDGRGRGPVAASLQIPPTDLTQLRSNNQGKYPSTHVMSILQSGVTTPGHGTAAMPVWGSIFAKIDGGQRSLTRALRISNLNDYLESIQAN